MLIGKLLDLFQNGTEFVIVKRTYSADYDDVSEVYLGKVGEPKHNIFGQKEVAYCYLRENRLYIEFSEIGEK